jgi:hypothetical protein
MENAGTVDMRGSADLPYLLKVIGTPSNPALAQAVSELRSWMQSGAHRLSPSYGAPYEDSAAIQIMDAWWPLLTKAIYEPVVGATGWNELQQIDPVDQPPDEQLTSPGGGGEVHMGSAWDVGFYGTVQTDLEDVLGLHPVGALQRKYCGRGNLSACRAELEASLTQAIAEPATEDYPGYTEGSATCKAGDQWCSDAIVFRALGAISQPMMQWVNRPTFQQADEVQGHRPFPPEPACIYAEYPTASIRSARPSAGGLTIFGRATPRACGVPSARLHTVRIAVARLGGGRCRFVRERRGRAGLGAPRRCSATEWLTARGLRTWSLRVAATLPPGRYRVLARAIDVSGNIAAARERSFIVRSS